MTQGYYERVAAAFDRSAPTYQSEYGANPIMAWLEDDTFERLTRLFPVHSRLLEIGCGVGGMAIRMAEAGREIVATDIAPGMIAQAQRAGQASPARDRITWLVAAAGEVGRLASGPFDGAYSNFGAFNCEPDLGGVVQSLDQLLRPGAALLCSVMSRWCAWEIAWGLLRLRPREALRRLGHGWATARMSAGPGSTPSDFPVRYHTPGAFAAAFRPTFRLEVTLGYPVLIPPPYLAGRFPHAPARLARLERRLCHWPVLRSVGDHFLLVLRRRAGAPAEAS